jgi:hypothetical protein
MTEEFLEAWVEETFRIQQIQPMLTWEACEMAAYANLTRKVDHENLDRQISEER